jgi:phosphoribosylglycinamide formyltransferase-1
MEPKRLRLAILASGRGSNFQALWNTIQDGRLDAEICIVISDKKDAPVLFKAEDLEISALHIDPRWYESRALYEQAIVDTLDALQVDIIVLAGYMRLVGRVILDAYPMRVLNIHPALLPSFPGLHAQKQALEYGVKYSGCTVHFVDEGMDTGPILLQAAVPVYDDDSEDSLAERILAEEHKTYAQALQLLAQGRVFIEGRKVFISK